MPGEPSNVKDDWKSAMGRTARVDTGRMQCIRATWSDQRQIRVARRRVTVECRGAANLTAVPLVRNPLLIIRGMGPIAAVRVVGLDPVIQAPSRKPISGSDVWRYPGEGRFVRISQAPNRNSMSFLNIYHTGKVCRLFRRPAVT
jgi:hypothetical protein